MNGDLRVSFKPVPATKDRHSGYVRMTASVNGTRFRMAIPPDSKEKLSLSSTLFRIYKEALLQNKLITAQELKKQFMAAPPSLLYDTIHRSSTSNLLSIGKTISFEQYQFQLKTIKSIPIFCQLTYGTPEISILALPDTFLDQLEEFFSNHSTEKQWLFLKDKQIPLPDLSRKISNKLSKISNSQLLFNKIPTIQYINQVLHIIALKSKICTNITFKLASKYYLSQQSVIKSEK